MGTVPKLSEEGLSLHDSADFLLNAKNLESLKAAVTPYVAFYSFGCVHQTESYSRNESRDK
jgi:hypothetical protein